MSELLTRAKKGDKKAFEELIQPIEIKLYKTARVFFTVEKDVLKVIKETTKEVFKEIVNVKNEHALLCLSLKFLIQISEKQARKNDMKKAKIDKDIKAQNKVEYDIYRRDSLLEAYITNLKKELRLISVLYFYDGLTAKEIGKILKISESNATIVIDEARKQLYEMILYEGVKKYNEYV